ncbi:hypothetical protein B0H16DRAFT_1598704, partial [Mycena metata]
MERALGLWASFGRFLRVSDHRVSNPTLSPDLDRLVDHDPIAESQILTLSSRSRPACGLRHRSSSLCSLGLSFPFLLLVRTIGVPLSIKAQHKRWPCHWSSGIKGRGVSRTPQASLPTTTRTYPLLLSPIHTHPPPMDSFTATTSKVEDIVATPVNNDGGTGSSGSCVV